jgi:hypothetical protein
LAYQPPASSTFLSEQTSHQQPANNTFLSEQTSTSHQHQPNEQAGGCLRTHLRFVLFGRALSNYNSLWELYLGKIFCSVHSLNQDGELVHEIKINYFSSFQPLSSFHKYIS